MRAEFTLTLMSGQNHELLLVSLSQHAQCALCYWRLGFPSDTVIIIWTTGRIKAMRAINVNFPLFTTSPSSINLPYFRSREIVSYVRVKSTVEPVFKFKQERPAAAAACFTFLFQRKYRLQPWHFPSLFLIFCHRARMGRMHLTDQFRRTMVQSTKICERMCLLGVKILALDNLGWFFFRMWSISYILTCPPKAETGNSFLTLTKMRKKLFMTTNRKSGSNYLLASLPLNETNSQKLLNRLR
jgi:hypothetical protein